MARKASLAPHLLNGTSVQGQSVSECEARAHAGKGLRQSCPRSAHRDVILGQGERDPLALIDQSNRDRVARLLPIRFERMAESPFAFFRGSAILQAHDLKDTPSADVIVQCSGDCHVLNFGEFATPERTLVFDINDFDETFPAPFEWDVKRLAVSLILAARALALGERRARRAVEAVVAAYRTQQAVYAQKPLLETWYAKLSIDDLLEEYAADRQVRKVFRKNRAKAERSNAEHVFHKIAAGTGGQPRIVDKPPLIFHDDVSIERDVLPSLEAYRRTLSADRRSLLDRYRVVDAAYKVVGVGSVATRCYVVLLIGVQGDPLFLQLKEARASVLEGLAGPRPFRNDGERVVTGQRLMQSASDIFLGWAQGSDGRDFYVRQLRDMRVSANLTKLAPHMLEVYGQLCGRTLARAHAKSGDAAAIAGYLGKSDRFDKAIAGYALAYADQVERDYAIFQDAVRSGRYPIEKMPAKQGSTLAGTHAEQAAGKVS